MVYNDKSSFLGKLTFNEVYTYYLLLYKFTHT